LRGFNFPNFGRNLIEIRPPGPTLRPLFLENGQDFAPFFLARSIELAEISNVTGTPALEKRRNPEQIGEYYKLFFFENVKQIIKS